MKRHDRFGTIFILPFLIAAYYTMVVSKAGLKEAAHEKHFRVSAKALDLMKDSLDDQAVALEVLAAAIKGAKALGKQTVSDIHVGLVIDGVKIGKKSQ